MCKFTRSIEKEKIFKMFSKLILISCLCFITSNASIMKAKYKNDAYPGKCYVSANLILSPGQVVKSPKGCSEIRCRNENGLADIVGCSMVAPATNCHWNGYVDEEAAFPLCCVEKFVCNSPADEVEAKQLQDHLKDMFRRQVEEKKKN